MRDFFYLKIYKPGSVPIRIGFYHLSKQSTLRQSEQLYYRFI